MIKKSLICFVCGKTNVGKSSLINAIVSKKVSIISDKPDTTRRKVLIGYENEEGQILYIDSPGINKRKDYLSEILTQISLDSIKGNDLIYYLVDSPKKRTDKILLHYLKEEKVPVFLVINKIDQMKTPDIDKIILSFKDELPFKEFIPVSSKDKTNLDILIKKTFEYSESDMQLFEKGFSSSLDKEQMITEFVREKIYYFTNAEIPYSTDVLINHKDKDTYYLSIMCEKESQKKILLGSHGEIIKKIRLQAQRDIKRYLNLNITLDIFVKVEKEWKNKFGAIKLLNYSNE